MPFLNQVHIDQALTSFSQAYTQMGLVGERVFPTLPVDKRSDKWFVFGREGFFQADTLRRPDGLAGEMTFQLSNASYSAEEHVQRHIVTDAEARLADSPLQPALDATDMLMTRLTTNLENDQAAVATSTAQMTQNTALSGTSQWSDYTNSVPLTNIRSGRQNVRLGVAKEATDLTLGYDVALVLADHPSIKDLIKYTNPGNIGDSGLPNTIRGLQVNEAAAVLNSQHEGQTQTAFASVWGKNAIVHYTDPTPGRMKITLGYTFTAPDDATGARGWAVRRYRDDPRKGEWVEVSNVYAIVVVTPLAAQLFTTAIA